MSEAAHARSGGASRERLAAVGQNRNPGDLKDAIVALAREGKSYTDIAAETCMSRGTVSGVVYRARKAGLLDPARPMPKREPAARPAAKPAFQPKDERPRPPEQDPAPVAAPPVAPHKPARVHLLSAKDGQCRWPLWGNSAPLSEKFFCGNVVVPGRSYCAHCCRLSSSKDYTAAVDRRLNLKKLARAA